MTDELHSDNGAAQSPPAGNRRDGPPPQRQRRLVLSRLFNYANNILTIAGIASATVTSILIIIFAIAEGAGAIHNPYVGVVAFVILPALFCLALLAIPIGMLRRKRRLAREGASAEKISVYPKLDFNEPLVRRVGAAVLVLTAVNAIILGAASLLGVEHMETVEFCGETCHTVMQPEYTAYQGSPHSRVACVQCHIGPGASWFVRSKLDGLRQVWRIAIGTYDRPIQSPIEDLRPARETCEQCHWPAKHHGDKIRVFARFATDEGNTPSYTAMVIKTGGGSLDMGRHGGIHWWHIYSDNRIRYLAGDRRREEIVWVELTTAGGEVRSYTMPGEDPPTPEEIGQHARTMDCIDCHNRPTHLFEPPAKALDRLLETRPELATLPFFKKVALASIEEEFPSRGQGMQAVRDAVVGFYEQSYPEIVETQVDGGVDDAAEAAAEIYGRTTFPEMGTDWQTHSNNIGHDDAPGCWRCHNDELATQDGAHVIPQDCETCHAFLVEDSPILPDFAALVSGAGM